MKTTRHSFFRKKGYTIVEALTASALIAAMLGGAVKLVATMNLQERVATCGNVALNIQDCAARLWQLGLSPTEVTTVLPTNTNNEFIDQAIVVSSSNAVTFGTATTTTLSNSMGTLETVPLSVTVEDPQNVHNNTNTVQVYRPQLR
jgi:phage-related baseplate assembly protein